LKAQWAIASTISSLSMAPQSLEAKRAIIELAAENLDAQTRCETSSASSTNVAKWQ